MGRVQGLNSVGEEMSSAYILHDPADYEFNTEGASLTRQEFAEECDINALMARYEKTGVISHVARGEPQYLDLSDVPDLATAMSVVHAAEAAFMSLPAGVRATFDNDPMRFIDFAENPDNLEQMRAWGLAKPAEPPPEPLAVRVVGDPPLDVGASAAAPAKP